VSLPSPSVDQLYERPLEEERYNTGLEPRLSAGENCVRGNTATLYSLFLRSNSHSASCFLKDHDDQSTHNLTYDSLFDTINVLQFLNGA
jgi:hypothetical protein